MQICRKAFTFVELIVVLTIVAILATIGFTVYESYLSSGRDTNRIVQLKDIHGGLTVYSTKSKLPFPEGMLTLEANGNIISYQGNISDDIVKAIKYNGGGKDSELGIYPTYTLSKNRKDFQLLGYVEDAETLLLHKAHQAGAVSVDYTSLFPKVIGSPLGIILDASSQEPFHESELVTTTNFDITTNTQDLRVYYSDTEFFDTTWGDIYDIIPNRSCNRIMSLGNSRGNGDYTILPDGVNTQRVYCNMEIDGGGWTLVARSVENASNVDFGWNFTTGDINDDSIPYSYGSGSRFLDFNEILNSQYTRGKDITSAVVYAVDGGYYFDNYDSQSVNPTDESYASNINECRSVLNVGTNHCDQSYSNRKQFWGKFSYNDGYYFSHRDDNTYGLEHDIGSYDNSDEFDNVPAMIFVR